MLVYPIWIALAGIMGAATGSFLNMLVYRLPEGKRLLSPASSACPVCGHRLAWFENLPIIAWIMLGGRCRYCKTRISFRYPLLEIVCAVAFCAVFICFYETAHYSPESTIAGFRPAFQKIGPVETWPATFCYLVLFASLIAATLIDARYFMIPLELPWFATGTALIVMPLGAYFYPESMATVAPLADADWLGMLTGTLVGLLLANILLLTGLLPRSFPDPTPEQWEKYLEEQKEQGRITEHDAVGPETWYLHPRPRLEALKEVLFLLLPVAGAFVGDRFIFPASWFGSVDGVYPVWLLVLAGIVAGYLIGGAIVWFVRILGTLGLGKEAMGLGDVHLLAAIGAVMGGVDAAITFFFAPFPALVYFAFGAVVLRVVRRTGQRSLVIPFGPFLAISAMIVALFREPLIRAIEAGAAWMGGLLY